MLLTVESVRLAKSGKSYTVHTTTGDEYLAQISRCKGIEQAAGRQIEAITSTWTAPDGKVLATIEGFTFVIQPLPQIIMKSEPGRASDRWWLNFVSNTVAHAIQAGLIKELNQLQHWARAAKVAALRVDQVADNTEPEVRAEFDKDIPF